MIDINTNTYSLITGKSLDKAHGSLGKAIGRLSSGLRVNSAKDDPAGLAIATLMQSQSNGLSVAARNANDAISMSQVADGALGSVTSALQQMRSLAVQSANAIYTSADRASLQQQFSQLQTQIGQTLQGTTFNGRAILASSAGAQTFQVGPNNGPNDRITLSTTNMVAVPGVSGALNATTTGIATLNGAQAALAQIDSALGEVNRQRSTMGAAQNRFDTAIATMRWRLANSSCWRRTTASTSAWRSCNWRRRGFACISSQTVPRRSMRSSVCLTARC